MENYEKESEKGEKEPVRKTKARIDAQLQKRFINLVDLFPAIPEKGKFDIQVIKDSPYFFS